MRNYEVTEANDLLTSSGSLREPGWSRKLIQRYNRNQIKAPKWRIKEWDYYLIHNEDYAICLTISDNGYMGLESVSIINLKTKWLQTESVVIPFPMGKLNMPTTSEIGDVAFENKRFSLSFKNDGHERHLVAKVKNFSDNKDIVCEFLLKETQADSMVIATPWDGNKKAFYYNQKINCLTAQGHVLLGEERIEFDEKNSVAVLDWGRGVWTYDNTWYWGNGNGFVNGKRFGFNLGYGFGNTTAATENIVYYDGISHKLDDIVFEHQQDFLKTWKIRDDQGRFNCVFEPLVDRSDLTDLKLVVSDQHQVFGYLSGAVVLDNSETIYLDNLFCFFEKVHNKF